MSRPSITSLDSSEFFIDDGSEGHRLVEFIQMRQDNMEKSNSLLMNYEPQRLSLSVQFEKSSSSEGEPCCESKDHVETVATKRVLNENNIADIVEPSTSSKTISITSSVAKGNPITVSPPVGNSSANRFQSPISIRKHIAANDKLRRYRFSINNGAGRGTLLNEFETSVVDGNFHPAVFSTPFLHPQSNKQSAMHSSYAFEPEGFLMSSDRREDLICLKGKDELEKCIENGGQSVINMPCSSGRINETNNTPGKDRQSPLKRAHTMENESIPEQVILISHKSDNTRSKLIKSEKGKTSFQYRSCGVSIADSLTTSKTLLTITSNKQMAHQHTNAPLETNWFIGLSTEEMEITETDDHQDIRTISALMQSDQEIPVNPTCNKTYKNETAKPTSQMVETNSKQCGQLIGANLTDDDDLDELLRSQTVENISQDTNYEILDLRKQNCENRHSVDLQEEICSNSPKPLICETPSERMSRKRNRSQKQSKRRKVVKEYLKDKNELNEIAPPSATDGSLIPLMKALSPSTQEQRCTQTDVVNLSFIPSPRPGEYTITNLTKCNNGNTHQTLDPANVKTKPDSNNERYIFKILDNSVPKSKNRVRKGDNASSKDILASDENSEEQASYNSDLTNGILRRSKREHVPLEDQKKTIFQKLFEPVTNKQLKYGKKYKKNKNKKELEIKKRKKKEIKNSMPTSTKSGLKKNLPTVPKNYTFANFVRQDDILNEKSKTKVKPQSNVHQEIENCEEIEHFGILGSPSNDDLQNNAFDQIKSTTSLKIKPFQIRIARLKALARSVERCNSMNATSLISSQSSSYELISWLKHIPLIDAPMMQNTETFKHMRISPASNLSFTQLQGLEYAFYDTGEKATLGYLRFKPYQRKPKIKVKHFSLHFITLFGHFRITTNDNNSVIGVGDALSIEKFVYYEIENITADIGILMVIKK